ncbi:nitrilase-related carbon-nitrogen hydrolase [Verrucomicrobium spinosum]|uniref:nitrilase-related carbon-nitrogen hydrolase n=1 Tax=Verrucomicrobium spinosum TaxID=2736 RepID=UPI001C46CEAF|nr:nitrilase-related carbon-nitrogen hydrolase [Verrucomicrobium spinosum]
MNVQILQTSPIWEDKLASQAGVIAMLERCPPVPGSLLVLPEMFSTGFSMNVAVTAQTEAREDEAFLSGVAMKHHCAVMGGVVSPLVEGKAQNESVTFGPDGELLARYAKQQLFCLGGEADCHTPGEAVIAFPLQGFMVAPFVCYDLRFPELFRDAAMVGANLLVVIASWPVKRYHHWLTLLQARAIENQAYMVGVNRAGSDPHLHYNGRSVVVSLTGTSLLMRENPPDRFRPGWTLLICRSGGKSFRLCEILDGRRVLVSKYCGAGQGCCVVFCWEMGVDLRLMR